MRIECTCKDGSTWGLIGFTRQLKQMQELQ
jgi:hypothetical protein